jgi:hypothetical protein
MSFVFTFGKKFRNWFFRRSAKRLYTVCPLADAVGLYVTDHLLFLEGAKESLNELETITNEVKKVWPLPLNETVREPVKFPKLRALVLRRDLLNASVIIFSQMAIEGFLNYYGVVRLGEAQYVKDFERLNLIRKLQALLRVCDSISVHRKDPIVAGVRKLTAIRNSLVHPKAKEVIGYVPAESRGGMLIPEAAQAAVSHLNGFFSEFRRAVPGAHHLLP